MPHGKRFRRILIAILTIASSGFFEPSFGQAVVSDTSGQIRRDEIDRHSVGQLQLVATFRTGISIAQSGSPQVAGSTLYLLTGFPHRLIAFELSKPGLPVKWSIAPSADSAARGVACCRRIENGPVVANGRVYFTTLDGHVMVVDGDSGAIVWDVVVSKPENGESLSTAPTVADSRVFVGNSGDDYGVRGWVAGLDAETGKELWKRYSTGPDADVGLDATFAPRYARDRGLDLGVATWPPGTWEHGGGTAGPILYDPSLGLIFHGTGHPAPWNQDQRTGDNKWTSGLFARDPASGAAKWFDQISPNDPFARGALSANVSVDTDWQGRQRPLLIHPDANGYVYVLDRSTGETLAADPFTPSAVASEGRAKFPRTNVQSRGICPAWAGATGSGASTFSPETGFLYIPTSHLCMDLEPRIANFIRGTPFIGANLRLTMPPDAVGGALVAWSIANRSVAWRVEEPLPLAADAMATAGGLVFYGTLDGYFKALDAQTGQPLWQFKTSSGFIGRPTSYWGPDGRQYVAVVSGLSDAYPSAAGNDIDRRDATAAFGLANAFRGTLKPSDPSATLYVFRLP
jgi:PQQ-dependent dehydrogenase (methanol/ethanol family)